MKVTIDISEDRWAFIKPMLEPYIVQQPSNPIPPQERINYDEIFALEHGVRIGNVLRDCKWDSQYTEVGKDWKGNLQYGIVTIEDLKRITVHDFMKHRNAGKKSWESLQRYIKSL